MRGKLLPHPCIPHSIRSKRGTSCQKGIGESRNRNAIPFNLKHRPIALQRVPQTGFSQKLSGATEVILEVKGGEGGNDSKLFARDLFAALSKYALRNRLKVTVLSDETGHVIAKITGANVWRFMQSQIGKHCVQRIPPTENRGRRHTSYLAVAILPMIDLTLDALPSSEIKVKTQRGHGPGGQHQNKTDSAVRMTHVPTGITVFINGRDQHSNRAEALRVLTARVRDFEQQEVDDEYRKLRKSQLGNVGRGDKIRTYNLSLIHI